MARIFAAADIGSNTAHLLTAAVDGKTVTRIDNQNEWIPLGEEVALNGFISEIRVQQLVKVMKAFRKAAASKRAEGLYVFGTESLRMASNGAEVLAQIKAESGVEVQIISPAEEARLSHLGIELDCQLSGSSLVIEVGGGSAQVLFTSDGIGTSETSLPIGTGRINAVSHLTYPAQADAVKAAEEYAERWIVTLPKSGPVDTAAASGGVIRGLWRALHPDGERELMEFELNYLIESVSRLTTSQIVERFKVKVKRAGTLLPGAVVYRALLRHFSLESIRVSEFGVREGAVLLMASGETVYFQP